MEVTILLKLEVDSEQPNMGDTNNDIRSKVRAYIADIVAHVVDRQEHISLLGSSLAVEIEPTGTVRTQPSHPVFFLPPDTKVK